MQKGKPPIASSVWLGYKAHTLSAGRYRAWELMMDGYYDEYSMTWVKAGRKVPEVSKVECAPTLGPVYIKEAELREKALMYAVQESGHFPGIDVVAVAADYLKFLKGGTA